MLRSQTGVRFVTFWLWHHEKILKMRENFTTSKKKTIKFWAKKLHQKILWYDDCIHKKIILKFIQNFLVKLNENYNGKIFQSSVIAWHDFLRQIYIQWIKISAISTENIPSLRGRCCNEMHPCFKLGSIYHIEITFKIRHSRNLGHF